MTNRPVGIARADVPGLVDAVEALLADVVRRLESALAGEPAPTAKGREDYVTLLDRQAHDWICAGLAELTPGIAVASEEGFQPGTADGLCWVVDPIDGSQNVAFRLSVAGSAVCLCDGDRVVLAVAASIWPRRVIGAGWGVPARARRFTATDLAPADPTDLLALPADPVDRVCLLRGTGHPTEPFLRALTALTTTYARVYQTRSPVIDLFLLIDGGSLALVCLDLTGYETLAVLYLAQRLGLTLHDASSATSGPWQVPTRLVVAKDRDVPGVLSVLGW